MTHFKNVFMPGIMRTVVAIALASQVFVSVAFAAQDPGAYKTATRYDLGGRIVGIIAPDPDGSGPLRYPAVRHTYSPTRGFLRTIEVGELDYWPDETVAPNDWGSGFSVSKTQHIHHDNFGRKIRVSKHDKNDSKQSLVQTSYDSDGRVKCVATRMNPNNYRNLPSTACTATPQGLYGSDRITLFTYDALDNVRIEWRAYGTSLRQRYVTNEWQGKTLVSQTDANNNRTELRYDNYNRLWKRVLPSKTQKTQIDENNYTEYRYDTNGNLTWERKRNGSVFSYIYDALNRMTIKYTPNVSNRTYYSYDLRGLTLSSRFRTNRGGVNNYFNGFGDLIRSVSNHEGFRRTLHYSYDKNGNSSRRYLHADHQGSIIAHTDNSGNALNRLSFDSFGIPNSTNIDRFGYTGQIWLKELGLYHYKARMYSPTLGRFLQTDPIFYEDQMNMYAYVGNDPMNVTDPTGMYGKGNGWSDGDWEKFDAAQKQVAGEMTKTASSLRSASADMKSGKSEGGPAGLEGASAGDLDSMANSLDAGAAALNDDGSGGYMAHSGSFSGSKMAEATVGGKTMTIDTSHPSFGDGAQSTKFAAGHESLHNAGLTDQKYSGNGNIAYRFGNFAQKRSFKSLSMKQRVKNPDHIMSQVLP